MLLDLDEFEMACLEQLVKKACEISDEVDPHFKAFKKISDQIQKNYETVEN